MQDIRVRFRKRGNLRYISHLDLTRTMTRAVRRAGLPIWYTEGFNRHPYLTFAAPLSLGFEGMEESMDFRIVEEISMEAIVRKFNEVLPQGLEVYAAGIPVMKAEEIAWAEYRLVFTGNTASFPSFLLQESIAASKRSKKGVIREIDLKPALDHADIRYPTDHSVTLDILLPCGSSGNINPLLIAEAYRQYRTAEPDGESTVFCDVLRKRLLNADRLPFA